MRQLGHYPALLFAVPGSQYLHVFYELPAAASAAAKAAAAETDTAHQSLMHNFARLIYNPSCRFPAVAYNWKRKLVCSLRAT